MYTTRGRHRWTPKGVDQWRTDFKIPASSGCCFFFHSEMAVCLLKKGRCLKSTNMRCLSSGNICLKALICILAPPILEIRRTSRWTIIVHALKNRVERMKLHVPDLPRFREPAGISRRNLSRYTPFGPSGATLLSDRTLRVFTSLPWCNAWARSMLQPAEATR
jgi:hypothetical protein